ncbi:MAG: phosphate/phosphite/phosphonate ABC transporter substrate-binding protein [Gammaproteobacteria bacterium]|nr:phosphate/phosphite/phosphonate ABC transporter substrate-binding protein [Gammaproteobacteria bacterium]
MRVSRVVTAGLLSIIICFFSIASYSEVKIGVLAPRGPLKSMKRWKNFSEYLTIKLGEQVIMVPLSPADLVTSVKSDELDLVLTNPVHTAKIVKLYNGIPLATLNKKSGPFFAGVIVSKKGSNINNAEDLKGKIVMSLKFKAAAGAYTFQTYHLYQKGIDPHKDFASMRAGKKQDDLVLAVKAGVIDAAFVRSGLLETMQREKKIKIDEFIIVDKRTGDDLNLVHSTNLYPEWYLTALPKTDAKIAEKAKLAALELSNDHPASKAAKINGFVEPISLDGMVTALKALNITPFNN